MASWGGLRECSVKVVGSDVGCASCPGIGCSATELLDRPRIAARDRLYEMRRDAIERGALIGEKPSGAVVPPTALRAREIPEDG
jgi:hypothetical protein